MNTPKHPPLLFAFIAKERPVWVLGSPKPSSELVWDVCCLPGKVSATAKDLNAAERLLTRLIDGAMAKSGGPEAWYEAAKARMTDPDKSYFDDTWGSVRSRKVETTDDILYIRRNQSEPVRA